MEPAEPFDLFHVVDIFESPPLVYWNHNSPSNPGRFTMDTAGTPFFLKAPTFFRKEVTLKV
jgi:hypothetical protein